MHNIIIKSEPCQRKHVTRKTKRGYFNSTKAIHTFLTMESYRADCLVAHSPNLAYLDSVSKYEATDLPALAKQQTHLSAEQQADLLSVWQQCPNLFAGLHGRKLGEFPGAPVHIELKEGARYSLPH